MNRTVIIGLDGVPFGLLKDFAESGVMPNTASLIADGTFRRMQSSIPEVSSVAWSCIITGKNPAEHGIFGFTDFRKGTYRLSFPNFDDLKALPFWQKYNHQKSVIINVPATYPVKPMNGAHISGFVSLDLKRSVYPSSLIPKLEEIDYRLDVDSEKAHRSSELFLSDLKKTLRARVLAYRYLWDSQDWQVFMLVFTGTDRLMHFFWDAYKNEGNEYHSAFLDHFRQIDEAIGEITGRLKGNDLLIMLSDHGFESLERDVYVNFVLKENGLLRLKDVAEPKFSDIDYGTKAFALDPARIYINTEDKYPRGSVNLQDKEAILRDLDNIFSSLEIDGVRVFRRVCRKEEIFRGPYMADAPDLTLIGNRGFNLRASITGKQLHDKGIFTGKHTQHDAFLLLKDSCNSDALSDDPTVLDVVNIVSRF